MSHYIWGLQYFTVLKKRLSCGQWIFKNIVGGAELVIPIHQDFLFWERIEKNIDFFAMKLYNKYVINANYVGEQITKIILYHFVVLSDCWYKVVCAIS